MKVEICTLLLNQSTLGIKQSKFSETQITEAIKKHENGTSVKEISREFGISDGTFYKYESRYGVRGHLPEPKRVKELES